MAALEVAATTSLTVQSPALRAADVLWLYIILLEFTRDVPQTRQGKATQST